MIEPTIGRVVWYWPPGRSHTDQPNPALISFVHSNTLINVGSFDPDGKPFSDTSVMLHQDASSYGNPGGGGWATWMPYQRAQATRTAYSGGAVGN